MPRRRQPDRYSATFTDDRIDIERAADRAHSLPQLRKAESLSRRRRRTLSIKSDTFIDDCNLHGGR